jgi:hypothetical protein
LLEIKGKDSADAMLEELLDKSRSCRLRACGELEIPDARQEAGQIAFKAQPFNLSSRSILLS